MTATEQARARRWNAGVYLALVIVAAGVFVGVLVTWPPVAAATLIAGTSACVGWWLRGRAHSGRLRAAEAAAVDAALAGTLAALGPVTDNVFAHRALVGALLDSWAIEEAEAEPETLKAADGMATELLWNLEGQGCRILVPGREPVTGEHDEIEVEPFMADSGYRPPAEPTAVPPQPFVQLPDGRWW